MAGRVTLKTVAAQAGCSVTVASAVLNAAAGTARFSEEVAHRVRRSAWELGYRSRTRRRSSGRTVALVIDPPGTHPYRMEACYLEEATQQLERCGCDYRMLFAESRFHAARLIEQVQQRDLHAAISFVMGEESCAEVFRKAALPLVLVNPCRVPTHNAIVPDDAGGARQGLRLLAGSGYRRIGYLDLDNGHYSAAARRDTIVTEAPAHGLAVVGVQYSYDLGLETLAGWVEQGLDCLVSYGEYQYERPIALLRELGLRVPQDVGLLCLSGIRTLQDDEPVTHLEVPFREMGRLAADLAVDMLERHQTEFATLVVPERLYLGSSLPVRLTPPPQAAPCAKPALALPS
jgi:DNA-binding LacI/PurR family transcriptional regulator